MKVSDLINMLNRQYTFTLVGQPDVSITLFPNDLDLVAGKKAKSAGKSMKAAQQVVRKRLMSRIQREGAEGARLVPVD